MKRSLFFDRKGFTLIEIIVCLILLGVIGTGVARYFVYSVEGFLFAKETNEACQKVSLAMERVSRELKNMDSVSVAGSDSVCFVRDGITFYIALVGTEVKMNRSSVKPGTNSGNILIDNVANAGFKLEYLQGDGTAWAVSGDTLSGLSRVAVTLTMDIYKTTRTFYIDINPLFNSTVDSATS